MKKCNYCDSMVPDSTDYCSVMCVSMAREEYLKGAYPRRGRAADEELKALRAEVERLRSAITRFVDQYPWQQGPEIQELKALKEGDR